MYSRNGFGFCALSTPSGIDLSTNRLVKVSSEDWT
jgi:hypothetical protein